MKKFPVTNHETILREIIRFKIDQNLIYEGLIFSYDVSNIFKGLKAKGYHQEQIGVENSANGKVFIIAFLLSKDAEKRFDELLQFMKNLCGWNLSSVKKENGVNFNADDDYINSDNEFIWLQFEPKFDVEVSYDKYPKILYHITPEKNLQKIKKIGLIPKSKSNLFSYDNRIYLSDNIDSLLNLSKSFIEREDKKDKIYIILKVNVNLFAFNIRLFRDPNFKKGYYTMENIHPDMIMPIIKIEIGQSPPP